MTALQIVSAFAPTGHRGVNGFQQPIQGAALAASHRFRTSGSRSSGWAKHRISFANRSRPFKREQLRLSTFPCETRSS